MDRTKLFIKRANFIHNNKYDYSKTVYTRAHDKVIIICPVHGTFEQKAYMHIQGKGCFTCGGKTEVTKESFLERAKKIHGNRYGYGKINFINRVTPVKIKCFKHGYFIQSPKLHMRGHGCRKCGEEYVTKLKLKTTDMFISDAKKVHGERYRYDNVIYTGDANKVVITCLEHGDFEQNASSHLQGVGCPQCKTNSKGEDKIDSFLKDKHINYNRQYKICNFRYSYDFYLPDYNLLIEYDGRQHFKHNSWGGVEELKNIQKRDAIKNKIAEDNNYKLLRISYKEFNQIEDIVMAKIKELENENTPTEYAVVCYSDGSAGPTNPGFCGSGVHGYIYPLDKLGVKTGNRPTKYAITDIGYIHVDELEKEAYKDVTPSYYINGCYTFKGIGTNNIGELQAVTISLIKIANIPDLSIKKITIKLDSEYVITLFKHVAVYDNVEWRNKITKNVEYLEQLREAIKYVKDMGITINLIKVKGHSNSLGNHNADRLAVMARMHAYNDVEDIDFKVSPAKNYYTSAAAERHPFLRFKNLYFMGITNKNSDHSVYSIMQYEKDMEPGRASHQATFGLIDLKTKQPMIEDMISFFSEKTKPTAVIASMDLDTYFNRDNLNLYSIFGRKVYSYDKYFQTIKFRDEDPVVMAIRPPGKANSAVERTVHLYDIIDEYNKLDTVKPYRTYIDITDSIFTTNDKGKTVIKITNKDTYIMFDVTIDDKVVKIPVYIGKDCITRDHFKQLENLEPKVMLVVKKVGESLINYYILIDVKATGDKSVWCNFFNNNIVIGKEKKK